MGLTETAMRLACCTQWLVPRPLPPDLFIPLRHRYLYISTQEVDMVGDLLQVYVLFSGRSMEASDRYIHDRTAAARPITAAGG